EQRERERRPSRCSGRAPLRCSERSEAVDPGEECGPFAGGEGEVSEFAVLGVADEGFGAFGDLDAVTAAAVAVARLVPFALLTHDSSLSIVEGSPVARALRPAACRTRCSAFRCHLPSSPTVLLGGLRRTPRSCRPGGTSSGKRRKAQGDGASQ